MCIANRYYFYKDKVEDDHSALEYDDSITMLELLEKLLQHINYQDEIIADYSQKVNTHLSIDSEANINGREVRKRMILKHERPRIVKYLGKPEI